MKTNETPLGPVDRGVLRALGAVAMSLMLGLILPGSPAQAGWLLPADPISVAGTNPVNPSVAISPRGETTVVWREPGGRIMAVTRSSGSGASAFSAPTVIADESDEVLGPEVAVGPDGETTVVWRLESGSDLLVRSATRPAGAGANAFSPPVDLTPQPGNYSIPKVAFGPDGETAVVWAVNGTNDRVQATTRTAGSSTFSTPVSVFEGSAENADLAIGPDGTTTVVWTNLTGPDDIIEASTRPAGAGVNAFSPPVDISLSTGTGDASNPVIAIGPDGETTVIWSLVTDPGVTSIIYEATREAGAANFFDPLGISGPISGLLSSPDLAFGPSGETYATWTRSTGVGSSQVEAVKRPSGSGVFSSPDFLSDLPGLSVTPQLTVDDQGKATVIWSKLSSGPASTIIQTASRAATASAFSNPVDLATSLDLVSAGRAVASGPCGSFTTAVWSAGLLPNGAVYQTSDPTPACPKLSFVSITYPKKMKKSKKKVWKVKVKNSGGLKLTGVEVRYNHPKKGSQRTKGTKKVGSLDPGKSKTVSFGVTIRKKGKAKVVITAVSSNGGKKEKKKTVKVK